jgi:hypothetical protein
MHSLLAHAAVAFGKLQPLPHPPQFASDEVVLTSQPLLGSESQSAKPVLQPVIMHSLLAHAAVAFGKLQPLPHAPQFATDDLTSTSHPSSGTPLQSAKPVLHAEHVPSVPQPRPGNVQSVSVQHVRQADVQHSSPAPHPAVELQCPAEHRSVVHGLASSQSASPQHSAHVPLQSRMPAGHAHIPATQVRVPVHG